MPQDTEDTNAPEPEPKPEPGEVIDVAALEREQYERQARLRQAYEEAEGADPGDGAAPSSGRHGATPRPDPEPEPAETPPPLYSAVATRTGRTDVGGTPLPPAPTHPGHAHTERAMPSDPPSYLEGEPTTRLLCATMHLQASFATHVDETLVNGSMQAVAPVWGVDPVALVRHARISSRLWAERDAALRWVIPSQLTGLVLLLASIMTGMMPWWLELALALIIPAAGWVYAWNVIYNHYKGARARALGVMDSRLPARDWAQYDVFGPVLSAAEEERLEDLARANVVCSSTSWPFVGDGQRVASWTLTVDLEKGTRSKDGRAGDAPESVSPLELHRYLLRVVPQLAPGTLHAQHRLNLRGPAAPSVSGLMPDPPGRSPKPGPRLPLRTIEDYARKPTPAARSYVAFQRVLWGGQILPTLQIRAERQRNTLFIEASEHVLPPLRATFHDVTLLPKDTARVRRDLIFASFHATWKQIVRSWGRWFENRRLAKADDEAAEQTQLDFSHGMPMNHGTPASLREEVSDIGRLNYFGVAEETLSVISVRRRSFDAIIEYLQDRNVDVADVKRQIDVIMLTLPVSLVDSNAQTATLGSNARS